MPHVPCNERGGGLGSIKHVRVASYMRPRLLRRGLRGEPTLPAATTGVERPDHQPTMAHDGRLLDEPDETYTSTAGANQQGWSLLRTKPRWALLRATLSRPETCYTALGWVQPGPDHVSTWLGRGVPTHQGVRKPQVSTTHEPVATQEEPGKTTAAKKHLAITPAARWYIRFARQPTPYHQASPPRPTLPPAGDPPRGMRTECEQPAASPLGGPPITRSDKNPTKKFFFFFTFGTYICKKPPGLSRNPI